LNSKPPYWAWVGDLSALAWDGFLCACSQPYPKPLHSFRQASGGLSWLRQWQLQLQRDWSPAPFQPGELGSSLQSTR
jgi:hypothetical protein